MHRRGFLKASSIVALVVAAPHFTGCSLASVYAQIKNYVGVGLQAIESVLQILEAANVIPAPLAGALETAYTLVQAAFAGIASAVSAYDAAPAADKTTLAGKIATALAAAEDSVQQFWNALKIPDAKLASLIEGLLGVIISTLSGFAAALPAPAAPAARAQLAKRIATPAQRRSLKQFKQDFNALLPGSGYEKYALR